ncbi:acyl-CoA dehydrogenase family protein, partial [Chloroflexota bacterium]
DIGRMETTAVKDGDYYVLNGTKTYTTAIDVSDFGLVMTVTDWEKRRKEGVTCFVVEKDTPGLTLSREIEVMGRRGVKTFEVFFDNCRVPAENVLGGVGQGLEVARAELDSMRLALSAACLGTAERALEMMKSYAKQRVTFGEPLARRQAIQQMIVRAETDVYASRLMLYEAATEADQRKDIHIKAMMIKVFITEMTVRVVDRAIQVHGGLGYSKDLPLEMMYRDTRLHTIGDGATEVLEWSIARSILRD